MPAMSFSFSAVSLTSFTTQWETGGNNDSGVRIELVLHCESVY